MIRQDAENYIAQYRGTIKAWAMAVGGFTADDSEALYQQLEAGHSELERIALNFPDKSYDVDLLINSRSRSWAGFTADRVPRPAQRRP